MPAEELISVIVPVHRAEATVRECIRSILDSDCSSFEVCAVVDPEDPSAAVLKDSFGSDSRVRILYRKNEGVSSMRNFGIANAQGSRIAFVDADDRVSSHYLAGLAEGMKDADCAVCSFRFCRQEPDSSADNRFGISGRIDLPKMKSSFWDLFDRYVFNPCWNKLFLREIIVKYGIRFPEGQYMGEDLIFVLSYLSRCRSAFLIDEPLYEYRIHPGQTIFKPDPSYFENICREYQAIRSFLGPVSGADEEEMSSHFRGEIKRSVSKICQSALSEEEKKNAICAIAGNDMVRESLRGRRDLYSVLIRRQQAGAILTAYRFYSAVRKKRK